MPLQLIDPFRYPSPAHRAVPPLPEHRAVPTGHQAPDVAMQSIV